MLEGISIHAEHYLSVQDCKLCRTVWSSLALTSMIQELREQFPNLVDVDFDTSDEFENFSTAVLFFQFGNQVQNLCNSPREMHTSDHLLCKQSKANVIKCTLLMQSQPFGSDQRRCRALHPNQVSSEVRACTNS